MIEERAEEIFAAGKVPFLLGGEHLVTLGSVRAAARRHPDLRIIHFDAHADLREDYLGNPLSHACVLRRCHDILGDGRIFQFGIRSGTRDERQFMRDGHVTTELFSDETLASVVESIGPGAPVYLTVDMDVLDPSEFPGTGTQEAGGLGRRPARAPEKEAAFARLTSFLADYRRIFNPRFRSVHDTRDQEKVLYDRETIVWTVLAGRLKRAFPRLPVCIVGDALYACSPVMRICRANGWKFILTFKEGRSTDAYEMACDSMEVSKG